VRSLKKPPPSATSDHEWLTITLSIKANCFDASNFYRCGLPSSVLRESAQHRKLLRAKRGKALSHEHIRIIETVHISDTRIIDIAVLPKNIFSIGTQNQSNPRRLVETSCCTFYLLLRAAA
jgi:hypothetical protein